MNLKLGQTIECNTSYQQQKIQKCNIKKWVTKTFFYKSNANFVGFYYAKSNDIIFSPFKPDKKYYSVLIGTRVS